MCYDALFVMCYLSCTLQISSQVGPNILQFLTHVWVQPEDLDSLLDHYVRERWGVPTIETFVPDPRPNPQTKVRIPISYLAF